MSDTFDVIMAAYQGTGPAEHDFDALVRLVREKEVRSEGVILVEHDLDGKVRVSQAGGHRTQTPSTASRRPDLTASVNSW